jgi:hypothetical protein
MGFDTAALVKERINNLLCEKYLVLKASYFKIILRRAADRKIKILIP